VAVNAKTPANIPSQDNLFDATARNVGQAPGANPFALFFQHDRFRDHREPLGPAFVVCKDGKNRIG